MKDLIYSVSSISYIIACCFVFLFLIAYLGKEKTSQYYKIIRNLCVIAWISALIACIFLTSFNSLIYPFLAVPIWLINSMLFHKDMINAMEEEKL